MTKSSKPKQKHQPTPAKPPARGTRFWRLFLFVATLIAIVVSAGGPFANGRAVSQMRRRDLSSAEWWLDVARWFPFGKADNEFLRARLARKRGDVRNMAIHLRQAGEAGFASLDIQREQWLAYAQAGQMDQAERHLSALLMDPRDDGAEILEAYTHGYLKTFRQNDALSILENWIVNFPDDAEPLHLRGHLWRDSSRWTDAEKDLSRAVERDPRHYGARLGLGNILVMNKKPQEALEHFEAAQRGAAQKLDAMIGQAKCHSNLGATDKARELLDEVLQADPGHVEANLDRARIALGEREYELAYQLLKPLVAQHSRNYDLRQVYSSALRRVGQIEAADREADAVAEARKELQRAHGLSLQLQKKEREGDVAVRHEVGMIHLKYSSDREGLTWLFGVFNYDPDHKPTHAALADYFEHKENRTLADQEQAERHRQRAHVESPDVKQP